MLRIAADLKNDLEILAVTVLEANIELVDRFGSATTCIERSRL